MDGALPKKLADLSLPQPEKALWSMLTTPLPIVNSVRLQPLSNIPSPIIATLFGMMRLVNPEQFVRALLPMLFTLSGMTRLVSPPQPEKALSPILVTLFGIVMLVNLEEP